MIYSVTVLTYLFYVPIQGMMKVEMRNIFLIQNIVKVMKLYQCMIYNEKSHSIGILLWVI